MESATKKIFEDLEPPRFRSTEKSSCNQFHELRSLYEQLHQRVNEANNLFGFLVIVVHALLFISICVTADAVLLNLKTLPVTDLILLPTLCTYYVNNVQLNTLICRPKDLYEVSYSLLLQIFGTIVTYTVIILQSA